MAMSRKKTSTVEKIYSNALKLIEREIDGYLTTSQMKGGHLRMDQVKCVKDLVTLAVSIDGMQMKQKLEEDIEALPDSVLKEKLLEELAKMN